MTMKAIGKGLGLAALAGAMLWTAATPASAEFFGCNDAKTKVSYSSPASRQAFTRSHRQPRASHDYSTRRTRSADLFAPYHARSQRWH